MTDDDVVEVSGRAGQPIVLPVGDPGATGYSWRLDLPDGVVPAGETAPVRPAPGTELGASSGSRLRVVAAAPGTYELGAELARPWEGEPIQRLTIRLEVS